MGGRRSERRYRISEGTIDDVEIADLALRLFKRQKQLRRLIERTVRATRPASKPKRVRRARSVTQRKLVEIDGFGSNPGRLAMLLYRPPHLPERAPLVVVLHGCLQTAQGFDDASGFAKLAAERRFAVLYPQQTRSNNPNLCFNWFRPSAVARDRGELLSIKQMIDHACAEHRLDASRVYIAGLSAGGAMANALLATYPESFAAGAIVAGLPVGAARDAMTALSVMNSGANRTPQEWGDLVRAVSPQPRRWPDLSIWQGDDDRVVSPVNAEACRDQWLDVRGLNVEDGTAIGRSWGEIRRWNAGGRAALSLYRIRGMGHGLPVRATVRGAGTKSDRFILEAEISAPLELMQLWGLKRPPSVRRQV